MKFILVSDTYRGTDPYIFRRSTDPEWIPKYTRRLTNAYYPKMEKEAAKSDITYSFRVSIWYTIIEIFTFSNEEKSWTLMFICSSNIFLRVPERLQIRTNMQTIRRQTRNRADSTTRFVSFSSWNRIRGRIIEILFNFWTYYVF